MVSIKKVIGHGGAGILLMLVLISVKLHTNFRSLVVPFSSKDDCSGRLCSKFLTGNDLQHFQYCFTKVKLLTEMEDYSCHFINSIRAPIALASFPGSGNTWIRGLLQNITGICTGGIYCDPVMRVNGYPGEYIRSGVVLVVKTHQTAPRWTGVHYDQPPSLKYFKKLKDVPVYSSAIFLVRNPFDALVADWNRQQTIHSSDNHVDSIDREHFGESIAECCKLFYLPSI